MPDNTISCAFSHKGENFVLVPPVRAHQSAYTAYLERNWPRFRHAMPTLESAIPLQDALKERFDALLEGERSGAVSLLLFREADERQVLGDINFTNIVPGAFRACHLGFKIDAEWEGQGIMRLGLALACKQTASRLGLHRIMANYRPENERSGNLLRRLGFEREGLARDYLHLDGAWRDHVLTSLVIPDAD